MVTVGKFCFHFSCVLGSVVDYDKNEAFFSFYRDQYIFLFLQDSATLRTGGQCGTEQSRIL